MKYALKDTAEATRAFEYLTELTGREAVVEIKKFSPNRSLPQNNYLHLLLAAFGAHFGYTAQESKLIYKDLNSRIYKYEKRGRTFYRSSRELTKEEMAHSIDRFRDVSAEQGYPLPTATDQGWLRELENAVEQQERYL